VNVSILCVGGIVQPRLIRLPGILEIGSPNPASAAAFAWPAQLAKMPSTWPTRFSTDSGMVCLRHRARHARGFRNGAESNG